MWQHIQTIFPSEPDPIAADAPAPAAQEEQPTLYAAYVAAMEAAVPAGKLPRLGKAPPDKSPAKGRAARSFKPY